MATTPRSQSALAADPNFLKRLGPLLLGEAIVVAGEADDVPNHFLRRNLAQAIIQNPSQMSFSLAPTVCNGTNLIAATTSYNFEAGAVETSATDPEIRSQISTLWDVMAGA